MNDTVFVFDGGLFSEPLKNAITKDITGSNIIKEKLLFEIHKINFNLKKESKNSFTLSLTTHYNNKEIHLEEKTDDGHDKVYPMIKNLVAKFEKTLRRSKI